LKRRGLSQQVVHGDRLWRIGAHGIHIIILAWISHLDRRPCAMKSAFLPWVR
jgi:hypothetical protein